MLKKWNIFRLRTALALSLVTVLAVAVSVRADETKLFKRAELKNLISNARTAQDHERLAQHFTAKAEKLEADAKDHEEYAARYKGVSGKLRMTSYHCSNVAVELRKAADAARQLATDHREMAKEAK
jgi:phosphoribulokinase